MTYEEEIDERVVNDRVSTKVDDNQPANITESKDNTQKEPKFELLDESENYAVLG